MTSAASNRFGPAVDGFHALAQPTRQLIVAQLAAGNATVPKLAQPHSISKQAVSTRSPPPAAPARPSVVSRAILVNVAAGHCVGLRPEAEGHRRRAVTIQARESNCTPLRVWWAASVVRSRSTALAAVAASRRARRSLVCRRPSTASYAASGAGP